MPKTKVYLAKSNLSDPMLVQEVRLYLKQFDVEIIEFKGGTYTNGPLMLCHELIIIPANPNQEYSLYTIGKGLYQQIKDFEYGKDLDDTYPLVVTYCRNGKFQFSGISNLVPIKDSTSFVEYAYLDTDIEDSVPDLDFMFTKIEPLLPTVSKPLKNKYLLLIK